MAVENEFTERTPVVDADEDIWGGLINTGLTQIRNTLDAIVAAVNGLLDTITGKVAKAGDTMTGELKLGDFGPTSSDSAGLRGAPIVNFDENKTLTLKDAAKTQRLIGTAARTLTIPPVGSVGFPLGTAIVLRNVSTQPLTIARGSGVTLTVTGSSTNKNCTLAPRGRATLLMDENNVWDIGGVGVG